MGAAAPNGDRYRGRPGQAHRPLLVPDRHPDLTFTFAATTTHRAGHPNVAFAFLRGSFFFMEVLRLIIGDDHGDPYRERIQLSLRGSAD